MELTEKTVKKIMSIAGKLFPSVPTTLSVRTGNPVKER